MWVKDPVTHVNAVYIPGVIKSDFMEEKLWFPQQLLDTSQQERGAEALKINL